MATSYKKTPVRLPSEFGETYSRDKTYWQNLEFPITVKEYSAISNIHYSPVEPHNYAATSSSRVQIYSPQTDEVVKTISRFKDTAYCGCFRNDGKLLIAGGEEGLVRLFDLGSRSILRTFTGHQRPVHVNRFTSDNVHIISCSDDKTVKYWDIPNETEISHFEEHTDYIRCGIVSSTSNDLLLTGSYDHTAKLFDFRTQSSVLSVDHGQPIESIIMFPNCSMFLTAGECIELFISRINIIAVHVQIYDLTTYKAVHSLTYPGSILSMALSPDERTLTVGMSDGLLSIQHRKDDKTELPRKKNASQRNYRFFVRNKPIYETSKRSHRLSNPAIVVSVLQELIRRNGLQIALAGRDEKWLKIMLKFLQKNITNTTFSTTLLDVTNQVVDIYGPTIAESPDTASLFQSLHNKVEKELQFQDGLFEVMGMLDVILGSASTQVESSDKTDIDIGWNNNVDKMMVDA
ncbi:U3 small nucleolar RNA-associated protein 15 homolog [Saccoglossus kowalevskii]